MEAHFSDPDGDDLTYTAVSSHAGAVSALVSGDVVWLVPGGAGSATVTVTARDPGGLSATQTVSVTTAASGGPQSDREVLEVLYDATGGASCPHHRQGARGPEPQHHRLPRARRAHPGGVHHPRQRRPGRRAHPPRRHRPLLRAPSHRAGHPAAVGGGVRPDPPNTLRSSPAAAPCGSPAPPSTTTRAASSTGGRLAPSPAGSDDSPPVGGSRPEGRCAVPRRDRCAPW